MCAEGAFLRMALIASKDRKSTRLNSSHSQISYAVFCLKKNIEWDDAFRPLQRPPPSTYLSHPQPHLPPHPGAVSLLVTESLPGTLQLARRVEQSYLAI